MKNRIPLALGTNMQRCFGKAWVTGEQNDKPTGAVGYYGGSVSMSWDPPATMSVGIAKAHFETPTPSLGGSVRKESPSRRGRPARAVSDGEGVPMVA